MAIKRCPQCRRVYQRGGRCPHCMCDMPTPATIRRRCLALQATWSEAERRGRTCGAYRPQPVETPVVERVGDGMRRRDMEGLGGD